MGHANVYIRKDNESKWKAIEDKSAWVNECLDSKPNAYLISPKLAKENPAIVKSFDKITERLQERSARFCKNGHAIPDGRDKCMGKGCKYA